MEEIEQLLNEQMQIELTSEGKEIEEKFKNIEEEIFNLLETKEGWETFKEEIKDINKRRTIIGIIFEGKK
ncbi:uncharacterized protein OCT59_007733 [Rhizophagus irregularis]|uniref:Uncharacterized protein n=1 Tax=Rhizophagus irregularis (strain DAOM 197198w) TaxID=1432141 RepID=A0A015J6F6_RHIIW|nr:hypothetical protein RirG_162580 [Rhizophagus irregularis DAOM 197198w]UZO16344.1 hypothetical protein OCT59_007733 [Rhizophagus irregularis]CAB4493184.1 unnamed protein product [Rhizophagus irregularis]